MLSDSFTFTTDGKRWMAVFQGRIIATGTEFRDALYKAEKWAEMNGEI